MDKHAHSHAAAPSQAHAHDGEVHAHVIPLKVYFAVWGALMVGTILTVAASFVHIGPLNVPIMLLIATTKATLVALFFMHLYYDEKFNLVVLLGGIFFVVLFFVGTLQDILTRGAVDPIERYPIAAEMDRLESGKQPILLEAGGYHGDAATTGTAAAHVTATPVHEGAGGSPDSAAPNEVPVTATQPSPAANTPGTGH